MKTTPFTSSKEVIEEFKLKNLPANFCHVPFTTLILEPDGKVGACRMKGTEYSIGDLNFQTLEEIWNGEQIQEWRQEFIDGNPRKCKQEVKHQKCNLCPDYNSLLPKTNVNVKQDTQPIRLALNLNGKCNLECQMCHIWKMPNGLYHSHGWWKDVEKWVDGVQEIELLSGEPFIQKDTYDLIDRISVSNPSCLWSITTNSHWKFTPAVAKSLDKIKFKRLIVSIDSLDPQTYSLIRKKGDLSVVIKNLEDLIEYEKSRIERGLGPLNIRLHAIIQKDNWREIPDFANFVREKNIQLTLPLLYEPIDYSLLNLDQPQREEIIDTLLQEVEKNDLWAARRTLSALIETLPSIDKGSLLLKHHEKLKKQEGHG